MREKKNYKRIPIKLILARELQERQKMQLKIQMRTIRRKMTA